MLWEVEQRWKSGHGSPHSSPSLHPSRSLAGLRSMFDPAGCAQAQ